MSLERDIQRGQRAKQLLEDELIQEAFATLEEHTLAAWGDTKAADSSLREELWFLLRAERRFRKFFEAMISDGDLAKAKAAMNGKGNVV